MSFLALPTLRIILENVQMLEVNLLKTFRRILMFLFNAKCDYLNKERLHYLLHTTKPRRKL